MRLTPDVRKMVISTLYGYLVVIHDLDLSSMSKDLAGQSSSNLFVVL
jgi:WD repeat-containing protein 32